MPRTSYYLYRLIEYEYNEEPPSPSENVFGTIAITATISRPTYIRYFGFKGILLS